MAETEAAPLVGAASASATPRVYFSISSAETTPGMI